MDLRNADLDGLLRRFVNKNRVDLNDRSLQTYQQRFRQTVDMYLKFIDGDPNWNSVKVRAGGARPTATPKATKSRKSATVVEMKPGTVPPGDSGRGLHAPAGRRDRVAHPRPAGRHGQVGAAGPNVAARGGEGGQRW